MKQDNSASAASTVPSYEVFPHLSTPEFVSLMTRLREARAKLDKDEEDVNALKLEAGAMVAIAGAKTVKFIDLKITNSAGGVIRGKVHADRLLENGVPAEKVAAAATAVDEQKLVSLGVAPHVIAAARDKDKERAGSTKLEWVK